MVAAYCLDLSDKIDVKLLICGLSLLLRLFANPLNFSVGVKTGAGPSLDTLCKLTLYRIQDVQFNLEDTTVCLVRSSS